MLKLTRLNHQLVVVNPDHIYEVEATPDTTLRLANGERMIVRETLDELIEKVVAFRRLIGLGLFDGAPSHGASGVVAMTERHIGDALKGGA